MRAREEGGRRIQLKKNDITCAARARESERGTGVGGGIEEARASGRNCIRWIGCSIAVDERGMEGERM